MSMETQRTGWGSRSPRGRGEWFSAAETPRELDPRSWACPASGVDANRPCCGRCRVHAGHTAGDRHAGRSQCRGRRRRAQPGTARGPGSWGGLRGRAAGLCVQIVGSSPGAVRSGQGAEEQKAWWSRPSQPRGQTCLSAPLGGSPQLVGMLLRRRPRWAGRASRSGPPIPDMATTVLLLAETGGQVAPE